MQPDEDQDARDGWPKPDDLLRQSLKPAGMSRVTSEEDNFDNGDLTADADSLQYRHKPLYALERPRELIVACPPMRSNVNLSRIVRVAGGCAVSRVICCGNAKVIGKIARDGAEQVPIDIRRTLPGPLKELRAQGYRLVALEQTETSQNLHQYQFDRRTVIVVGNERHGVTDDILRLVHDTVEIPVWGLPYSYNAATATTMALYEYCRQFPAG